MRNSSQSASSNFKVKREQNRLKKEERQREKEEVLF
jgi:S-DNA-T family DNA segregation ATPase FtsK/SpoIIIE